MKCPFLSVAARATDGRGGCALVIVSSALRYAAGAMHSVARDALAFRSTTGSGGAMDIQGILALETRRYEAMTNNDLAALAALLHDDLVYTHSSGVVDSKASYLEALRSGRTRYLSVEQRAQEVKLIGDVALMIGASHIEVDVESARKSLDLRSLAVWTATPAGWQFIAWQSCRVIF